MNVNRLNILFLLQEVKDLMKQLAEAVVYMHDKGITCQ